MVGLIPRRRRRPLVQVAATVATVALLAGCMANPSDAPTVNDEELPAAQVPGEDTPADPTELTIGVDEFVEGFNPHLIADSSPVTRLVARLTLPSAFIPAPSANAPGESASNANSEGANSEGGNAAGAGAGAGTNSIGADSQATWLLNEDLLEEAVPVDKQGRELALGDGQVAPAVRYTLRPGAQWSDGTPISGEDFRYLHAQITSTPGTIDAALYEAIDSIDIAAAGREITVTFEEPTAGWQRLFANLLPQHLLRTSTDGFTGGLDGGFPASGGRYAVRGVDLGRNVIRLVRNDRYWASSLAASEEITLRAVRSAVDGAEQLRSGQIQAAQVRPRETTQLTFGLVPGVSEFLHEPGWEMVLNLNLAAPRLEDIELRSSILSTIRPGEIAQVATGRSASNTEAPAATPTSQLRFAGLVTPENPLRIGVISDGVAAPAAAWAISDQLTAAGIPARVITAPASELLRSHLPYGTVDAVVGMARSVADYATARARYQCTTGSVGSLPPEDDLGASTSASTSAPASTSSTATSTTVNVAPTSAARAENLSGLCNAQVDALFDQARTEVPLALASLVEAQEMELHLFDDVVLTAIGPSVAVEPFRGPTQWPRDAQLGVLREIGQAVRIPEASASGSSERNRSATNDDTTEEK